MKNESYIKLYRKITDWEHYPDSRTFHLFVHLLLSAARKPMKFCGVNLKPGQYLTTYDVLQEDLGMCRKYLSESIKALCETGEIKKEMRNGRTLFTIINFEKYQGGKPQKQSDSQEDDAQKDDESSGYGKVGATFF